MIVEDQSEAIAFLERRESHGLAAGLVERFDTHGAVVFLAGDRAYKLKRAVRFPYMDFSTLARREAACRAELAVNARTAAALYRRVAAVTREPDGRLALDGAGTPVEWLVVMRRFDQEALLDRMAARGALTPALMEELADVVAAFHAAAERRPEFGGAAGIARVIGINRAGFAEAGREVLDQRLAEETIALEEAALARIGDQLERRRRDGFVRHCHGDLHLRNVCLFAGLPMPFDAIEFNDDIACIDTQFDLAFLLMDLERRGLRALANVTVNRYLDAADDYAGLGAMPLFLSCRAGIRAHTTAAAAAAQPDAGARTRLVEEARACLSLARAVLAPPPPRLVAIGGLSGTGKSTLARALAPRLGAAPGAVVIRSDVVRKRLAGVDPLARLPESSYTPEASRRVYARLGDIAAVVLAAGQAAVVDAVFGAAEERAAVTEVARTAGAPFAGLWLQAPADTLESRVAGRKVDASDATVAVLRQQLDWRLDAPDWVRVEAGVPPAAVLARAASALSLPPASTEGGKN